MTVPSILHIDTGLGFRGGQRQLMLLARGLKARGFSQVLAVPTGSPLPDRLPAIPVVSLSGGPLWRRLRLGRLWKTVDDNGINIIHAHDSHGHSLGIALKKSRPNLKLVVSRRVIFKPTNRLSIRYKYLRHVDRYIAVSHAVAAVLRGIGVADETISVIHSALDLAAINADTAGNDMLSEIRRAHSYLAVTAGALTAEKDMATAIEAIRVAQKTIPGLGLIILGDGPQRNDLKRQIVNHKAGGIYLLGHVEPMTPVIKACDIFLLTSTSEGLNNSALEAAACGLPLVVSNVGGLPEIVDPETSGRLCLPGDPGGFAAAIVEILGDETLRQAMASAARRSAEQFDIGKAVEKIADVYIRLCTPTQ